MEPFASFYEREYLRVLATCQALGRDADAAREATDEAFARAFERWRKVGEMTAPGGWVQVVATLPARQQLAVILRYVHDLPEATIAEAMGVARGTVASTLNAAHTNLRRRMAAPAADGETSRA
jgi:DNA-directed RNA polymerase specialized sigma24 family protein